MHSKFGRTENKSNEKVANKIQQVKQLESDGTEVLVLKADVSDDNAMENVIIEAKKRFGNINGVIHAAGTVGEQAYRTIQETNITEFQQQFKTKIAGTLVLEKILKERELDFCVLCSSIATILGGLGFSAYSAANQYMDVFARQHNKTSLFPWISINWDAWHFDEKKSDSNFSSSLT